MQIVSTYPPLRRPGHKFFWEASRASPQHGWRSAYSLRETLNPTQDQNQHYWTSGCSRENDTPADQLKKTPGKTSLEILGCRTPPQLHAGGVGRQQHGISLTFTGSVSLCCVCSHVATRGNNKILRTPTHISSSEELRPRLSLHSCPLIIIGL